MVKEVVKMEETNSNRIEVPIKDKYRVIKLFDGLPKFLMVFYDGLIDFRGEFLMGFRDGLV